MQEEVCARRLSHPPRLSRCAPSRQRFVLFIIIAFMHKQKAKVGGERKEKYLLKKCWEIVVLTCLCGLRRDTRRNESQRHSLSGEWRRGANIRQVFSKLCLACGTLLAWHSFKSHSLSLPLSQSLTDWQKISSLCVYRLLSLSVDWCGTRMRMADSSQLMEAITASMS